MFLEIPLFHVLNAVVTFGNVFAIENPVPHVSHIRESDERVTCVIDDACFEAPSGYGVRRGIADFRQQLTFEDEDELMQFAIQQSLVDSGSENDKVDIWEALKAPRPLTPLYYEDEQLQRYGKGVAGSGNYGVLGRKLFKMFGPVHPFDYFHCIDLGGLFNLPV